VSWKAIVHSAIGTRHEQRGQPCQDYGGYRFEGTYLLGAVSDGAGSAKHAEVGAQIAVESALEAISKILTRQFNQEPTWEEIQQFAPQLFAQVFEDILCVLHQEAITSDYELRDLGCTLLAFVATSDWVAAMQIGDGFMMLRSHESAPCQLLFKPDKGEFINETIFVTSPNAIDYMNVCVEAVCSPFLCAATDGLERVAVRLQDWKPYAPFFQPFEDCLTKLPTTEEQSSYLKTFLESERLNAKTDDDKTLLVCLYSAEPREAQ
jgi:Protein phosphatase 2C